MTECNRADRPGCQAIAKLAWPGARVLVGETLICPTCGMSGVVCAGTTVPIDGPSCHGPMKPARPVPCDEVRPCMPGDAMVGGYLYVDMVTGFALRCTRGGPRRAWICGRPLCPQTAGGALRHPFRLSYQHRSVLNMALVVGTDFGHSGLGTELGAHQAILARDDIKKSLSAAMVDANGRKLHALAWAGPPA